MGTIAKQNKGHIKDLLGLAKDICDIEGEKDPKLKAEYDKLVQDSKSLIMTIKDNLDRM